MSVPSEQFHCQPCAFEILEDEQSNSRMLEFQASLVRLFADQLVNPARQIKYPEPEDVPLSARARHSAAERCAKTIVANECPLFIYDQSAAARNKIQPRPKDFSTGTLRIVK